MIAAPDGRRWRSVRERALALGDGVARDRALVALADDGALSGAMARWALETTLARYADEDAPAPVGADLAGRAVALVLARSVATAPLRAVALALARGAASVRVHAPASQRAFGRCVADVLGHGPWELSLASGDERGEAFVASAIERGADAVIAFGGDATLARMRARMPAGVHFEGRGHGVGASVVLGDGAADPGAADAVARDVAAYDQRGCLSPQCVLLEGSARDAAAFAQKLADALARAPWPRGPVDPGLAVALHQWQGATAARAAWFRRGEDFAVGALERAEFVATPGARHVAVVPCGSLEGVRDALAPVAGALTCVGVAGRGALSLALPPGASPRVVAAGAMQDPPLDGYEDPRPPVA